MDRFKDLFRQHYLHFQRQGLDDSTATAEALKAAHRDVQSAAPPVAPPVPSQAVPSQARSQAVPSQARPTPPPQLTVALVNELLVECNRTGSFIATPLVRAVGRFFSDIDALIEGFTEESEGEPMAMEVVNEDSATGAPSIRIDINSVSEVYRLLLNSSEGVGNSLLHALDSLGFQLQSTAHLHATPRYMKVYLIVLEQPELFDPKYSPFLSSLLQSLEKAPVSGKILLVNWIKERAGFVRYRRQVAMLQQFLTMRVLQGQIDKVTKSAAKALGIYYAARGAYAEMNDREFYNDALNGEYLRDEECIKQEFHLWMRDLRSAKRSQASRRTDEGWSNTSVANLELLLTNMEENSSFVSFPYVLSPASKAKILEIDAISQMNHRYREERREASQRGATTFIPYFVLCVRREHVKDDSLVALVHGINRDEDLKRPLKVIFDGEEGVDAGGVRKEYFQLILSRQQFLNPSYGMFTEHPESHLLWFNSHSFENQENFELIGTLLGIAIYNSVLVDLPMPSALYKKLKGHPCTLDDLAQFQPDLCRSLRSVLEFDGDVEITFQLNFQISFTDIFGVVHSKDLKPNASDIMVTNDNRYEFVDLYINYIFNDSVETQFSAFAKGFNKLCAGNALDLFTPVELEFLLCGNPVLDFDELEQGTDYQDGYDSSSQTITYFWQVLREFDETEKKTFLKFATGSDRAPIDGLSQLGLVVSKNTDDNSRLPSAHTCFNHILLPAYSSVEVLRAKLKYAMEMAAEGFQLR